MTSNANSNNSKGKAAAELPPGFTPSERDVVIGKGKKYYFHSGNQWLRNLVASMLDEYKKAQTKSDKSNIISDVVEYVHQHGRFVRKDSAASSGWLYAEPLLCREKVSQTFRDNLAETYRSSNVAKRNKRRQEQQEKRGKNASGAKASNPKRMRLMNNVTAAAAAASGGAAPPAAATAASTNSNNSSSIPPPLFDTDMPLTATPTLQGHKMPRQFSLFGSSFGGDSLQQQQMPQQMPSLPGLRRESLNLLSALPELLGQINTAQGQSIQNQPNPFEPTPLQQQQQQQQHQHAPAPANLNNLDLSNINIGQLAATLLGGGGNQNSSGANNHHHQSNANVFSNNSGIGANQDLLNLNHLGNLDSTTFGQQQQQAPAAQAANANATITMRRNSLALADTEWFKNLVGMNATASTPTPLTTGNGSAEGADVVLSQQQQQPQAAQDSNTNANANAADLLGKITAAFAA